MKKVFTAASKAWLSSDYKSMDHLQKLLAAGKDAEAVNYVSVYGADMGPNGWVEIGTAVVTVELYETDAVAGKQIAALQQELRNERAESMQRQNYILERISKLQAITYTPEPSSI